MIDYYLKMITILLFFDDGFSKVAESKINLLTAHFFILFLIYDEQFVKVILILIKQKLQQEKNIISVFRIL